MLEAVQAQVLLAHYLFVHAQNVLFVVKVHKCVLSRVYSFTFQLIEVGLVQNY